jgi:hypothetical protein
VTQEPARRIDRILRTAVALIICTCFLYGADASRLAAPKPVLWRDPGPMEKLDLFWGPGGRAGAPQPPFTFLADDPSGSSPKVTLRDARGVTWYVKFGEEVKAETFASRMIWAAGYYVEALYFVPQGKIEKLGKLSHAAKYVASDGGFANARFEFRDPKLRFLKEGRWTWLDNPFVGTHELNALKIMMMLVSFWDNKDARDEKEGSNTAILERRAGKRIEWIYFLDDIGGSMGHWGNFFQRTNWNCGQFSSQTKDFIKGMQGSRVLWGYSGRHTDDFTRDIGVDDVKWLMQRLGRLTDAQIARGLEGSGATPEETQCFTSALRRRITALEGVAAK